MKFNLDQVRKKFGLAINQETQMIDLPDFDIEEISGKNWSEIFAKNNLGRVVYLLIEQSQRMQSKFLYFNLQQKERESKPPAEQYKFFEVCLAYLVLNALPFWEKDDLAVFLQQHTSALLEIDSNPAKSIIDEYLFLDPEELAELTKKCLDALRSSKEKVADSIQGKLTIGGAITAYLAFVRHHERASIDEISFLNSGNEIRGFSIAEKDKILSVLKFYDHLEFPLLNLEAPIKPVFSASVLAPKPTPILPPKQSLPPAPDLVRSASSPTVPAPVAPPKQPLPSTPASSIPSSLPTLIKPAPQSVFAPTIECYDAAAEKLVKESGLNVAPELQQRFKMIVVSRLKEVRKWVETRQKLMSPLENGGMGFSYEQAEKFLKLVESRKSEIASASPRNDIKAVATPVVSALVMDSSALPQNDKKPFLPTPAPAPITYSAPKKVLPPKENFSKDSSLAARNDIPKTSSDITKTPPQPLKIVQQEKAAPKVELAPMPLAQIKPALKIAIPQTPAGRSKMEDVAYKPRLVGPVEELREMTLVDFRRLSPQAKVTADKIYAKIELLAEESYEKKILGIKAWQESEVNKMYLGLLNESVNAAKPVQKMVEERQGANRPTLTYEEFKTVMELNRRLRA